MTRHRKGLRPLSQTGLHRIPKNPRQRNFGEGGTKAKGTVLSTYNKAVAILGMRLHPTKGWRFFAAN